MAKDDLIRRSDAIGALDDVIKVTGKGNADAVMQYCKAVSDRMKNVPAVDAIPLGEEFWMNKFNIRTRGWRADDGELMGVSFIITRKEAEDGRPD